MSVKSLIIRTATAGLIAAGLVIAPVALSQAAPSGAGASYSTAVRNALAKAPGATTANITEIKFERDNRSWEWDIRFVYRGVEYEVEINTNGRVEEVDTDKVKQPNPNYTYPEFVRLVLNKIPGATAANIEAKYDADDHKWEGKCHYAGYEYEFEFNDNKGKFTEWERER